MDRVTVLLIGLSLLIAADLFPALSPGLAGVIVGVVLWGLHIGFTQGLLSTLIADAAPADLRGTADGMFNLLGATAIACGQCDCGRTVGPMGASTNIPRRRRLYRCRACRAAIYPGPDQTHMSFQFSRA
jgi:MFS family permease